MPDQSFGGGRKKRNWVGKPYVVVRPEKAGKCAERAVVKITAENALDGEKVQSGGWASEHQSFTPGVSKKGNPATTSHWGKRGRKKAWALVVRDGGTSSLKTTVI